MGRVLTYREGTTSEKAGQVVGERIRGVREEIARVRAERLRERMDTRVVRDTHGRRGWRRVRLRRGPRFRHKRPQVRVRKPGHPEYKGARVATDGEVFGVPGLTYSGVVKKWGKFTQIQGGAEM